MKKINTKNIIAVVDGSDLSELRFATKDGEQTVLLAEPLEDGTKFIVPEDDEETETDCVHVHGEAAPLPAWCELIDIYGEDEETWENVANDILAYSGLKLGGHHRTPIIIEGSTYDDGWYELETR